MPQSHGDSKAFLQSGCRKWQNLALANVWMLTVCSENVNYSFCLQDIYSLRMLPYTDQLLRLANMAFLFN